MSFDTPAENKAFAEKCLFNFPLLCDGGREMGLAYGSTSEGEKGNAKRVGCVIDPDGNIKDWRAKVDAGSYPSEVLALI